MKLRVAALGVALACLPPAGVDALEAETAATPTRALRVVEIRVNGDAAALERVRLTAGELLRRLDVEPDVRAIDEPGTGTDDSRPLVIAYVDLRSRAEPSIDIEDGTTHLRLTERSLSEVTSLETGVEAVLHVLYLAVESTLQVGAVRPPVPAPAKRPAPPAKRRNERSRLHFGFDLGPLLRLSSLGGSRIVPGGGVALEPRVDFGRAQASLLVSAVLHGSSELVFARGEAEVRPLQLRVVPTFDWLLTPEVTGCFGLGAGLDSLLVNPLQQPEVGRAAPAQSATDPVLTGLVGARVPISGRVFLAAMASLDLDLAPTTFTVREGSTSHPILRLPAARGGFTLALSFTAAGERRFAEPRREP